MRCNTKQSIYYSASSLYMFRVSTTPIIRSTQNCNYSLWYCAATSLYRGHLAMLEGGSCTKNMTSTRGCSYIFVYSWWWVCLTPETCTVNSQNNRYTALCCISLDNYWYRSMMHGTMNIKKHALLWKKGWYLSTRQEIVTTKGPEISFFVRVWKVK